MHLVCCCSLPVWRRNSFKKGTPSDLFWPRPRSAPGRIWPKTTTLVRDQVLVISCLSTKPSVIHGLAFAYYTHWNSHCWSLFNRRGILFTSDFLIFTVDLFIGKIFFESCSPAKSLKINLRYVYVLVTWKTLASSLCINAIIHLFLSTIA